MASLADALFCLKLIIWYAFGACILTKQVALMIGHSVGLMQVGNVMINPCRRKSRLMNVKQTGIA